MEGEQEGRENRKRRIEIKRNQKEKKRMEKDNGAVGWQQRERKKKNRWIKKKIENRRIKKNRKEKKKGNTRRIMIQNNIERERNRN